MLGIAPGAYWTIGDRSNTSPSSALGTVIFTQKKQVLITAKATTFFHRRSMEHVDGHKVFNLLPTNLQNWNRASICQACWQWRFQV